MYSYIDMARIGGTELAKAFIAWFHKNIFCAIIVHYVCNVQVITTC